MSLRPLGSQQVSTDDSVLGPLANSDGNGLANGVSYATLIQAAFRPTYWNAEAISVEGYRQIELNFPIFRGLSIQAYETTLIASESRYDQFQAGDRTALTAVEQAGMREFQAGGSQCTQCHGGPELTAASFTN